MAGAGGADGVHRDARIAVPVPFFKSNRAGERWGPFLRWICFSVVRAPDGPS